MRTLQALLQYSLFFLCLLALGDVSGNTEKMGHTIKIDHGS
jgi:hypothetical protein